MPLVDLKKFSAVNLARAQDWHDGEEWSEQDWLTAAVGEFGEAANYSKKILRLECGLPGNKPEDSDRATLAAQMCEELADTATYLDLYVSHVLRDCAKGRTLEDFMLPFDAGEMPPFGRSDMFTLALHHLGKAAAPASLREERCAHVGAVVFYLAALCHAEGRGLFTEMRIKFNRVSERIGHKSRV